jgi:hypothetical protein
MALVAHNNVQTIIPEGSQISPSEANSHGSERKEKKVEKETKSEKEGKDAKSGSTSTESGPSHTVQKPRKYKKTPQTSQNAAHENVPDLTNSDSDSEDENEEEAKKEAAERDEFLAQGREANRKIRDGQSNTQRPISVEKEWQRFYVLVKTWWSGKPLNHQQNFSIERAQKRIEEKCATLVDIKEPSWQAEVHNAIAQWKNAKQKDDQISDEDEKARRRLVEEEIIQREKKKLFQEYRFPVETLHGLISTAAAAIEEVHELGKSKDEEDKELLEEEESKLIKGIALITEALRQYQIPAQCVVTQFARETFDTIVNKNDETKEKYANTIAELNKPTPEQKQVWTIAVPEIKKALEVIQGDNRMDVMTQHLDAHIGKIKSQQEQLEHKNREQGLGDKTNGLPFDLLLQMQQEWISCQQEKLADSWNALVKTLEGQSLATELYQRLHTQVKGKMRALESTSGPPTPDNDTSSSSSSSSGISTTTSSTKVSGTHNALQQPAKNTTTTGYLSMQLNQQDVIKVPDYSDGTTEHGRLVATRLCRTDNPRFSRFILHAGTEKCEHYRVVRANDLGPGGAEALQNYNPSETQVEFDLRKRKREMKTNRIVEIGPCVVMARAESYTPRSKQRRPDTYVKVKYNDQTLDWLSRTEMIQLVGQKYAEVNLAKLVQAYDERVRFFDAHKEAGIHPDTKQPLQSQDQELTPWLFPEDALSLSTNVEATDMEEDEDVKMGGIKIKT